MTQPFHPLITTLKHEMISFKVVEVLVTDTMQQGSLLDINGKELDSKSTDKAEYIIIDNQFHSHYGSGIEDMTGKQVPMLVTNSFCAVIKDMCVYSDGVSIKDSDLKYLETKGMQFGEELEDDCYYMHNNVKKMAYFGIPTNK